MINLKEQLHEGCTVHFRCGGSAVVDFVDTLNGEKTYCHGIAWKDCHLSYAFYESERYANAGHIHGSAVNHPFDIVKIDPKPFDWKDVKQGMCFTCLGNEFWYYIYACKCPLTGENLFAMKRKDNSKLVSAQIIEHELNTLTRYEEGDLQ